MEEILASIKRIIAEDGAAAAPRPAADDGDDEDVLELDEPAAPPPADPLVSSVAAAASRSALASLSGLAIRHDAPVDTVEGLVRELIRPMLKDWLDANLPGIVERMVAIEIARIGQR